MEPREGTLVELNEVDSLGWIELDDGTRLRVGGTALAPFAGQCPVGTRLLVLEIGAGFKGVPKAMRLAPIRAAASAPPPSPPAPAPSATRAWDALVRACPRFSDVSEQCLKGPANALPIELVPNPLFAPWAEEIARTAPVIVGLNGPAWNALDPIEPDPAVAFAHGRTALLDDPAWPSCGQCGAPLEMCLQLPALAIAPWLGGDRGLVAMFCFACGGAKAAAPRVGYVRRVAGHHRVTAPTGSGTHPLSKPQSQCITLSEPFQSPPDSTWHRLQSARPDAADFAATALFGEGDSLISGPFPEGFEDLDPEQIDAELDDWLEASWRASKHPRVSAGHLGGVPRWDQSDRTPRCPAHGRMRLFLDYNAIDQFGDGALHVFACRDRACAHLAFVAEL